MASEGGIKILNKVMKSDGLSLRTANIGEDMSWNFENIGSIRKYGNLKKNRIEKLLLLQKEKNIRIAFFSVIRRNNSKRYWLLHSN